MNYKFKHLEKHHRVELSEKIYRTTKNYNPIGDLVELIDKIIDVYISSNMRTTEPETPKYTAEDMQSFFSWANNNGWYYGELTELWYNDEEDLEGFIIDDVIKIWEEMR